MRLDKYPIRRIEEHRGERLNRGAWPATIPVVAHLLDRGLDLGPATVLVGENGSGKSTIVEGIALAYGLSPEGGSTGAMHTTRVTESQLGHHLQLVRNAGASRRGYFLRAETMHGLYTYLENNPGGAEPRFHDFSHGESFVELVVNRFRGAGLWVLDEPESALSVSGCLALLGHLKSLLEKGDSQVILSTHSPLLAALPGATIYEVGPWGLRVSEWEDLDLVSTWKSFLESPERFLRHLD
jgi:predicted ATPase